MLKRTVWQRAEDNLRGEMCRIDRVCKRRPPTDDEWQLLVEVYMDYISRELVGHAETILWQIEERWGIEQPP